MDSDPGEPGKDAHRLHRLPRLVHHKQCVLAGPGAVHPVQPALRAEAGLVEPRHRAGRGGDLQHRKETANSGG